VRLLLTWVLMTSTAFACKPAPYPACESVTIQLAPASLAKLQTRTNEYQAYLEAHAIQPERITSCYRVSFGVLFLSELAQRLLVQKGTCAPQVLRTRSGILGMIDQRSENFRAVPEGKHRQHLLKLGRSLKAELDRVLPTP
jgi:hypothetical protein